MIFDKDTVMPQNFHAIGAAIGKQFNAVRLRRTNTAIPQPGAIFRCRRGPITSQIASMQSTQRLPE